MAGPETRAANEAGSSEVPASIATEVDGAGSKVPVSKQPKRPVPKVLLVVVSVLADLLMSGITYGYSGVVGVLTTQTKAFASLCKPGETLPCPGQTQSLTAAYTLSSATTCGSGIPVGLILDAVGPRHTTILGSLVFALGLLSFTLAPAISDQLYHAGFFLLALGGPAIITANMNFADLFPPVASAIISAQNGAFDASSAVMFFMGKAVTVFGTSLAAVMLAYTSVPLALIVIAALLFPDKPFGPDFDGSGDEGGGGSDAEEGQLEDEADDSQKAGELWRVYRLKLSSLEASSGQEPQATAGSHTSSRDPLRQPLLSNADASTGESSSSRAHSVQPLAATPRRGGVLENTFLVSPSANQLIASPFMASPSPRTSFASGRRGSGRWPHSHSGSRSQRSASMRSSHGGSPPEHSHSQRHGEAAHTTAPLPLHLSPNKGTVGGLSPIPDSLSSTEGVHAPELIETQRLDSAAVSRKLQGLQPPPDVYNSDVSTQLMSSVFWVLMFVSCYLVMRSNFYIGSINEQLAFAVQAHPRTFPDPVAAKDLYVDLFNYVMPLGGLLSIPITGFVLVQFGMTTAFLVIGVLSSLLTVLQILAPSLPLAVQVAGFVVYAVLRSFMFGALAAFMGQVFGFRNFGTLLGVNRAACAVATVVQYPLISLADHNYGGDYRPILWGFLVIELSLLAVAFPWYLWKHVYYGYFFSPPEPVEEIES